jgi:DNA-nicking Smr family endonuclease
VSGPGKGGKSGKSAKIDPKHPFAALAAVKADLEAAEAAKTEQQRARTAAAATSRAQAAKEEAEAKARGRDPGRADEALSFHRLMSGVTPLNETSAGGKALRIPRSQETLSTSDSAAEARRQRAEGSSAAEREAESVRDHLRTLVEGGQRFEVSDDGRRVEGRRLELPPDALRKLRRGVMPIDGRTDLHGLHAEAARQHLETFLRDKRARGERCVLVVHGKGDHSPGGHGVLRGEIAAWLSQGRASESVAAFASADETDGGEGAVYVLLRR